MKKIRITIMIVCSLVTLINEAGAQCSWTQEPSLPGAARFSPATFTIGKYGFLGCGKTSSGYATDFWKWNPGTNSWSSIASYPGNGQNGCVCFSINGKGYVGLGTNASGGQTDLWEYDTATNTWTARATFPGLGRRQVGVFVIGHKAYLVGGTEGGPPYYDDVWVYDAVANTWTQKNNFPYGTGTIAGQMAFSMGNHGYECGGGDDNTTYNGLWEYDTGTDKWSVLPVIPLSGGIGLGTLFTIGNKAYAGTGQSNAKAIRQFFAYDTGSNTWSTIASLNGGSRQYAGAFTVNNIGYVCAGTDSTGAYLNDFWAYPCSENWQGINGISYAYKGAEINLSPNPSEGNIHISYHNLQGNKTELEITDMMGRVDKVINLTGHEGNISINMEDYANGIYFYRVITGNREVNGKFIIAR